MSQQHTVLQGECLSSIAKKYGFLNYRTIYDHPNNSGFKKKRPNPHVIFPGDVIYIPDKLEKNHPCTTGKQHPFTIRRPKSELRIVIKDADGKPLSNTSYQLDVGSETFAGKTNGDGLLKQEIPIGTQSGTLFIEDFDLRWDLDIGHLDPVHDDDVDEAIISGVQGRLNNLGFFCGEVDGILGPKTTAALKRFQESAMKRKDPDGQPDKETRDALLKEHCC